MNIEGFKELVEHNQKILIIQADNPDGDSLASALALELLFADLGKEPILFCGVELPSYLRYMSGWDRVQQTMPHDFDASIIVDTSAISLLESLQKSHEVKWLKTKPCVIIDHHGTAATIDFATITLNEAAVSTGELMYRIFTKLKWNISPNIAEMLAYSILSDSLGLTSEAVTSETFRIMGSLLDRGVTVAKLDDARKSLSRKSKRIVEYKGKLLSRIEFPVDPRIALITIPWEEIEKYSHEYNPSMLVIDEMRMIQNIQVAIAFKTYPDGKITAKIRSNYGYKVAGLIAEHFGGGGHEYAAGFKIIDGRSIESIKNQCIQVTTDYLNQSNHATNDGTIQHTF